MWDLKTVALLVDAMDEKSVDHSVEQLVNVMVPLRDDLSAEP